MAASLDRTQEVAGSHGVGLAGLVVAGTAASDVVVLAPSPLFTSDGDCLRGAAALGATLRS